MEEVSRRTKWALAFGLACLPCTAAFLVFLGSIGGGAIVAALGWPLLAALGLAAVGAVVAFVVWRRRRACEVPSQA